MNFNNKLLQNFFTPQDLLNNENCLKIEKIIGRESQNECKEVKECESLRVTKGKIVFNQNKKKNFGDDFQKILQNFMNKKAGNNSIAIKISKRFKKTHPFSSPFNKVEENYLNEMNYLNISSHSSSINDGKVSPKKIFVKNSKNSIPIFTKLDLI